MNKARHLPGFVFLGLPLFGQSGSSPDKFANLLRSTERTFPLPHVQLSSFYPSERLPTTPSDEHSMTRQFCQHHSAAADDFRN